MINETPLSVNYFTGGGRPVLPRHAGRSNKGLPRTLRYLVCAQGGKHVRGLVRAALAATVLPSSSQPASLWSCVFDDLFRYDLDVAVQLIGQLFKSAPNGVPPCAARGVRPTDRIVADADVGIPLPSFFIGNGPQVVARKFFPPSVVQAVPLPSVRSRRLLAG